MIPKCKKTDKEIASLDKSNTYSTEEQKIGTWINGKTLYRKIILTSCPNTAKDGTYEASITDVASNIETAFIEWSFITDVSDQRQPLLYINNAGYVIKSFINDAKQLYIANSISSYNGRNIVSSILYTKITA